MDRKVKWATVAALTATGVVLGAGVAIATGGDDAEAAITGDALNRASAAALDHLGQGRVSDTEAGDEESYYEVEVTLDDGSQVDVQLTRRFEVVGSSADVESPSDDESSD